MENFNYHRPTKPADAVKAMKKAKDGKFLSGGMTLLPTMKQGLAAPSDIIDLGGLKNTGVAVAGAKVTVQCGDTACRRRGRQRCQESHTGAFGARFRHRRPACAQSRHDRRLDRQQ